MCLHPGCGKIVRSNRKVLRKHLISHQEPTHACEFPGCTRSFHERSKLKRHQLVHSGEKQYKCQHEGCNKTFAYKANMKTHMRTHTGQRPFRCSWPGCTKTFTQASNRSTHMNVHKRSLKRKHEDICGNSKETWEVNKLQVGKPTITPEEKARLENAAVNALITSIQAQSAPYGNAFVPGVKTAKVANASASQILSQCGNNIGLVNGSVLGNLSLSPQLYCPQALAKGVPVMSNPQAVLPCVPSIPATLAALRAVSQAEGGYVNPVLSSKLSMPIKTTTSLKPNSIAGQLASFPLATPNVWYST